MKLTIKLVSAFMAGMIVLIAVNAFVGIQRQVGIFEQVALEQAATIVDAMEEHVQSTWEKGGIESALDLIQEATEHDHRMEFQWVWLDAPQGDPHCPAVPRTELTEITLTEHRPVWWERADGTECLHVYWPIPINETRQGALELYQASSELDLRKRNVVLQTLLQMAASTCLAGLIAVAVGVRVVGRPLERLIQKTRRIATGDLAGPVQLRSRDELEELAGGLNRMCDELAESQARVRQETADRMDAMEHLRHADRLQTVGRLASDIAHDLGTPLNVISGRAGLIASGKLSEDEAGESAQAIKAEADKMTTSIRQLLDFVRRSPAHRTKVDLRHVVRQAAELLLPIAEKHRVTITEVVAGEPAMTRVDVGQMQQVLTNLTVNAIHATPSGGKVEFGLHREHAEPPADRDDGEGEYFCLSMRDEGEGIPPEHLERVFEPFFTTKESGKGTGLGLSIVHGIVQEHGGWIEVTSQLGKGTCFKVYLPAETEP
jgi:signal transduction histidine kinase